MIVTEFSAADSDDTSGKKFTIEKNILAPFITIKIHQLSPSDNWEVVDGIDLGLPEVQELLRFLEIVLKD